MITSLLLQFDFLSPADAGLFVFDCKILFGNTLDKKCRRFFMFKEMIWEIKNHKIN